MSVFNRKEALSLWTLAAIQFTHIMDFMIMMPLAPIFMKQFGISAQAFGVLVSSYAFAAAIAGLVSTSFVDRFDRKRLILTLYVLFALATAACALSYSYVALLLARIAAGAFGGVIGALAQTYVGDTIDEGRRGRATAILMSAFALATVAGVPFGLWLATQFDWHAPFWAVAGMSGIVALVGWLVLPAVKPASGAPTGVLGPIKAVLSDSTLVRGMVFMFCTIFASFSIIPFISVYMTSNVGIDLKHIPLIYMVGGIATLISRPIVGAWADKYGKARVFVWCAVASTIPFFTITHLPPVPLWVAVINSAMFFVIVSARMIPGSSLLTSIAQPQVRGAYMALSGTMVNIASGAAAFVAGLIVIADPVTHKLTHYNWVGYMGIGMGLLSAWLAIQLGAKVAAHMQSQVITGTK